MAKSRNTKQRSRSKSRPARPGGDRGREIAGVVSLGVAIFSVAALLSIQIGDGRLMGPFGRATALLAYGLGGMCAYLAAAALGAVAVRLLIDRRPAAGPGEVAGFTLGASSLAVLAHLVGADYRVGGYAPGGVLGESVAEVCRALVSTAGTVLLAIVALVVAAVVATPLSVQQVVGVIARVARLVGAAIARAAAEIARFCGDVIGAILPERDRDEYLDEDEILDEDEVSDDELEPEVADGDPPIIDPQGVDTADAAPAEVIEGDTEKLDDDEIAGIVSGGANKTGHGRSKPSGAKKKPSRKTTQKTTAVTTGGAAADPAPEPEGGAAAGGDGPGPRIVESQFMNQQRDLREKEKEVDQERLDFIPLGDKAYQLPPVNLLRYDDQQASALDRQAMLELSAKLTQTLENYGVKGEVTAIRPGPVVTMYEFAPAPGTRINKIVNLTDDLAMALEALRVRIVAPIPGKAAVGIEVPNKTRETVYLKEIIADDVFQHGKRKLPLALGKNIEGAPSVVDLAKMPHMLVAGTTGSGKSVAINSMITSLLYSATPEEVRMIMVDPKMLELSVYEGVPHLLLPVVTDPKKANLALRWAVEEMERRYDCLAGMGVRDIANYNKKLDKLHAKYEADRAQRAADAAARYAEEAGDDDEVEVTEEREHPAGALEEPPKKLPYIVVVIDEFADLMMCAPKEVEQSVARIAQKARAAGIHLILATQRPSVDVITGLIKANFPSRCAFHVTSKVDSRTVLDQSGAEALLGLGDMLFSDRGGSPKRYHGCFVDEDEVHEVVDFLKAQGKPVYNLDILKPREEEGGDSGGDEPVDEMYDKAVALVAETRQASISMIQRRLRVGYNRAARMVEHMEKEGVVGPADGTNKREVLITAA